jgi:hypothetical protein
MGRDHESARSLPSITATPRGHGNLHVAGRIKGTVAVTGDVTIEAGALIDGEVKAASLTVAPGARMRGVVEFGWKGDTVELGAAEQAGAALRGAGGGPRSAAP